MGKESEKAVPAAAGGGKKTTTASEDFKKNILSHKRYVDKTRILIPLLDGDHETSFFLRPRRFGKTLTLSMLRYYLEDTGKEDVNAENRALFDGLEIMDAGSFYTEQMTSYPVINLTFQGVRGDSFKTAYAALTFVVCAEYDRHRYLMDSAKMERQHRAYFQRMLDAIARDENDPLPVSDLAVSLQRLSQYLTAEHGKKCVVLIDEYDVPLEKAWQGGYYAKMTGVISPLLQNVLKTNSTNLQFAVVTGCLRVAKESIYTGLNNPMINTVLSASCSDAFGFTEEEVKTLFSETGLSETDREGRFSDAREWYDGYRFGPAGRTVIYNPWSVIDYIERLKEDPHAAPGTPWAGTSSNAIIRRLAQKGSATVREKAERLMLGEAVSFAERDNIVYEELDYHDDNVFNVMLHAGYLTALSLSEGVVTAAIPNREVRKIYRDQISDWFRGTLKTFDVRELYAALFRGGEEGAQEAQRILATKFFSSMSYYDTLEAYYHGVLLALFQLDEGYIVDSNGEAGRGRFDIQCRERTMRERALIIEVKVSKRPGSLVNDAKKGAQQVRTKRYAVKALREGYREVYTYGISFYQKSCAVHAGDVYTKADLEALAAGCRIHR